MVNSKIAAPSILQRLEYECKKTGTHVPSSRTNGRKLLLVQSNFTWRAVHKKRSCSFLLRRGQKLRELWWCIGVKSSDLGERRVKKAIQFDYKIYLWPLRWRKTQKLACGVARLNHSGRFSYFCFIYWSVYWWLSLKTNLELRFIHKVKFYWKLVELDLALFMCSLLPHENVKIQ